MRTAGPGWGGVCEHTLRRPLLENPDGRRLAGQPRTSGYTAPRGGHTGHLWRGSRGCPGTAKSSQLIWTGARVWTKGGMAAPLEGSLVPLNSLQSRRPTQERPPHRQRLRQHGAHPRAAAPAPWGRRGALVQPPRPASPTFRPSLARLPREGGRRGSESGIKA